MAVTREGNNRSGLSFVELVKNLYKDHFMNNVIIVAIGRELVNGRTLDTNSRYLARNITILGLRVASIHVIDDVPEDIVKTIRSALAEKPSLFSRAVKQTLRPQASVIRR